MNLIFSPVYDDGDIPDNGIAFYEQLQQFSVLTTPVSLLALGDKAYAKFCEAGHLYQQELERMGAAEEDSLILVDGNPIEPMQQWLQIQLGLNSDESQIQQTEKKLTLELVKHQTLTKDSEHGNLAYRLVFNAAGDEAFNYQVGDLLAITPPDDSRERLYSIASAPSVAGNQVELCVGLLSYQENGETVYGRCSQYLTTELKTGNQLQAKWKSGGGLTLPESDTPMIMVATGAGIAPMMCLLNERIAKQHAGENWLLFGNRKSTADYYYQDELEAMQTNGQLHYLDTAFSRESEKKVYVQDILAENRERLADWLLNKHARLYVCGRRDLRGSILDQVRLVLSAQITDPQIVENTLKEMELSRQICLELF
ncbi:flavodoxin domain-containing protein [Endozoicomonas ascidiicola]|uniref:flavodoxin domain-containing protein n=1 Tax=Endozoicomonas ascidiicola TaxID=1698521 RepID=UPI00083305B8|nr:NADPH cytochrome P450 oxidoreductase family protein [Endozoicomonas ascidiicola]